MERPNYYAILPANVRYDDSLKANEKLLYGEITALSNKLGYCYASNSYFAKLYKVHKDTVSRWISNLKDKKYIKTVLIKHENSMEIKERRIYINVMPTPNDENINRGIDENINRGIDENINRGIDENIKDNNTSFNTTSINNNIDDFFNKCWNLYPNKKGKGKISYSKKKEIYKLGDEFKRCIERYIKDTAAKRQEFPNLKYQYGSTFWNSGYVDYLDENYGGEESATNDKLSRGNTEENNTDKFTEEDAKRAGVISL